MRPMGVTGWGGAQGLGSWGLSRLFGRNNNNPNHINEPPEADCEKPRPLQIDNPTNPSSWYEGITKMLSSAQNFMMCIERKLTQGLLGDPNVDPNFLRHLKFIGATIIGMMYDLFAIPNELAKQNKEANKQTFSLFKAAA